MNTYNLNCVTYALLNIYVKVKIQNMCGHRLKFIKSTPNAEFN